MVEQATTQTSLCNMAIGHIAGRPITSITENSVEAEQCLLYFDAALSYVLSDYDWKFCSRRKLLVPMVIDGEDITQDDLDGWQYLYEYPSDCAKVRKILTTGQVQTLNGFGYGSVNGAAYGPPNELFTYDPTPPQAYTNSMNNGFGDERAPEIPFNIGLIGTSKYIFTDVPNARARYTQALSTLTAYPADFGIMFSYYLAHLIAFGITRKLELKKDMLQAYEYMKGMVQANNSNEGNNPRRDPPAPWVRARQGY